MGTLRDPVGVAVGCRITLACVRGACRCATRHTRGMLGQRAAFGLAHRKCSGKAALVHAVSTAAA